jgi:hypothetical protein
LDPNGNQKTGTADIGNQDQISQKKNAQTGTSAWIYYNKKGNTRSTNRRKTDFFIEDSNNYNPNTKVTVTVLPSYLIIRMKVEEVKSSPIHLGSLL